MQKGFSCSEAINFGWETFKKNIGLFLSLALVSFAVSLIPSCFNNLEKNSNTLFVVLYWIIYVLAFALNIIVSIGIIKIILNIYDKEKASIGDVFGYSKYGIKYFLASFLYLLIVVLGVVTPLISGIIWAIKVGWSEVKKNGWYFVALLLAPWLVWIFQYQMVPYLIIDKDVKIIEAFIKSTEITKNVKLDLFAFGFMMCMVMLIGFLMLLVGIFAAIPVMWIAQVFVYRKILGQDRKEKSETKVQLAKA